MTGTDKGVRLAARALEGIARIGAAGTLVTQNDTYSAGGVTGVSTSAAVVLAGPVDESTRYAATGAASGTTATFHLAASGVTTAPDLGDHILFGTTEYVILGKSDFSLQGVMIAWRLDVGEIGLG